MARAPVESEDVVGAALTGDAPTTSEWSTILWVINNFMVYYDAADIRGLSVV